MKLPYIKRPCKDCPMRKDSLEGWLGEERMKEIMESDTFVCHKQTDMQCAGHMLMRGDKNIFVATAKAMNIPLDLKGKELCFDSKESCVKHHKNLSRTRYQAIEDYKRLMKRRYSKEVESLEDMFPNGMFTQTDSGEFVGISIMMKKFVREILELQKLKKNG